MRIAIISDIHGNREALDAVLLSIQVQGVDRIICLGDIVGYGPDPGYCLDVIMEKANTTIIGNHDHAAIGLTSTLYFNIYAKEAIEWTSEQISYRHSKYLHSLPFTISEDNVLFVHATPDHPQRWGYIFSEFEAEWCFENFTEEVCFIGHSHIPVEFQDKISDKRIINVGSVGQPRDEDPRSCYYIFDTKKRTGKWIRVEYPYDITAKKIKDNGLPGFLAERLLQGR